MKKLFYGAMMALAMLFAAPDVQAQPQVDPNPQATVPVDSAVRVGKLANGLTYYIRHNETPKGQADFFIAQKVGSILEEENQRGLAHFLEHMCFNGTKNFPGNKLIDWLETKGVKFGYNLNAYTSIDETVYNISSVPVADKAVVDSCLLILHDWADDLLLETEEINKERGVIHQEWRRTNVGNMRIMEQILPKIYAGNKYGERLPIGTMEVVDNFDPQVLRDYYEAWYRPDQQGIIVVGDIDVDYIEGKIKEIFSPIQMPANAKERVYLGVEDTPGTIFGLGTDKEMPYSVVAMMFKQPQRLFPDELNAYNAYFYVHYCMDMIAEMMNSRYSDMAKKADCPFAQADLEIGDFLIAKTKDAVTLQVVGKGDDVRPAFEAAYRELQRAAKGGFTQSEYDRVKAEYLSNLERQYGQRNGRENTSYAREYAQNFTNGDPIPGIGYELAMAQMIVNVIPLEQLNQMLPALLGNENRVVMGMFPDSETFHAATEEELQTIITKVEGEELEAFKDEMKDEPLVPSLDPAVDAKVSENAQFGATELSYPNGVKVIIKPTKFKENEILMDATAKGGMAALNLDGPTAQFMPYAIYNHGLGTYTSSDLQKYLQGTNTQLGIGVDDYMRAMSGQTTPKNLKTLMELVNMTFRGFEISADDFDGMRARIIAMLQNQEKTPDYAFEADHAKSLYKAAAKQAPTTASLAEANREETVNAVKELFNNPGAFTFVFTGDINVDTLTALCNQYIGSLPAARIADVPYQINPDFEPILGPATTEKSMKMETPQTYVYITMTGKADYTPENRALATISGQILSNRLLKKIREEMGAVYSIGAAAQLSRLGDQNFLMRIPFPMKPELKNEVLPLIKGMVEDMAQNVTETEFQPIQEFLVKDAKESLEKNDSWLNGIAGAMINGVDTFTGAADVYGKLKPADVQAFMKAMVDQNNYRVFTLDPAE